MTDYFLIYRADTGALEGRGAVPDGGAALQQPPQGCAILTVPVALWQLDTQDLLPALIAHMCAAIDQQAEATRGEFITSGSGQAMTYLRKEAEAAAYLADNSAVVPFLTAEALATGVTVAALAAVVAARAAQWAAIGPRIEAARMAAKQAVAAAANIAAAVSAAHVDWATVVQDAA
ncbi:hypothetical protein [Novosphingobium sp. EMRT-2]|uniref:hypothetical protein n=1 Tax=Novosphingobium sp. EMRT-2 TaxID=2571749 RepID=UPI0010BD96AE|nr:hypothetical protein [Novosphingobium sp. EMRT-2]QCI92321.1 hypothetical protein FA702_01215 [Novosphingobium sp. EMRT-2]